MAVEKKLDKKFYIGVEEMNGVLQGYLHKAKDDSVVPDDCWVAFMVWDNAFNAILPDYYIACEKRGCDAEHLTMVRKLMADVAAWRAKNPDRCHEPSAAGEINIP